MSESILAKPPVSADRRVSYGEAPSQFFDVFEAQGDVVHGSALVIHGGFWRARYDLSHISHLCAALAAAGVQTASLEYRRVGEPGGGWPGTYQDAVTGIEAVQKLFEGARLIAIGHSAGGHLALRLAANYRGLSKVVALAPVACLDLARARNLSGGAVDEFLQGGDLKAACPSRFSSTVERVLIHGGRDADVPPQLSYEYLSRRCSDTPAPRFLFLPEVDHFDVIDPASSAWPTVLYAVTGD